MRTGVWLIGARGSVAVTSTLGALGVRAGLADPTGCVLESPGLHSDALPGIGELVFGGHDISSIPLDKKAAALAEAGIVPARLAGAVRDALLEVEQDVRPLPVRDTQAAVADAIGADLDRVPLGY
ncbi:inositol-3-phosphate synthase [Nonomuraea sp. NPDC049784]|uniref:inositol-3-phosphate synthase n=1 Tax=Nonomuraea sp. NPDC049784 TaxID=3154361 RepID=UPI003407F90E